MSQPVSIRNNDGFTLVEVLVAVVILAVGMFGVLQSINVSLQYNLKNELRNEGNRIGEKYMADLRGKTFDKLSTAYTTFNEAGKIRSGTKNYTVERATQILAYDGLQPSTKQVTVIVKWSYRNMTTMNRVVSVVARP
ncbi:prepilin-type N-terminal cleavage/methylation domain-containing protein [Geomonas anaerohicana]|uniref:Prepilin-type N-terminal cleavage/methylation domain-containing protein n=1 Tax=Geomonas anaerohicana TaxID=2798583 RepID=A0ABS0YBB7_9BACT|nr:prepilin-type N-terminal cleavage/methylation domain-containing protein [Geomonas anaerohicana]MBJ6749611.1 prepilin-type N-terminal cleavage/methylation domain-containing protein [Geomonas anaerohicana]